MVAPFKEGYTEMDGKGNSTSQLYISMSKIRSTLRLSLSNYQPNCRRVVYVDNKKFTGEKLSADHVAFPDNTIVTSEYTFLSFLPKNLFKQFMRVANFYFLCVCVIQMFVDSPISLLAVVAPLTIVISVSAVSEGYEDWLRHKADNLVNHRKLTVIRDGCAEKDCKAMHIKVGDIVKVNVNKEFPCDLLLLSSSDPQGTCNVQTANLDGETNLKTFTSLSDTRNYVTAKQLGKLRCQITAQPPLADLYTFEGTLKTEDGEPKFLETENLLLRGARLKNTEFIYGVALYTGIDTKLYKNIRSKRIKFSRVEKRMNHFLLFFLPVLMLQCIFTTSMKYYHEHWIQFPDYIPKDSRVSILEIARDFLSFMVLFNYLIPISLYATIEVQKFLGSIFFGQDAEMYDETINERALAKTSNLGEELGQVEYLFTDKTGTLTENKMVFKKCCIGSKLFEEVDGDLCEGTHPDIQTTIKFTTEIDKFMQVLVLCHTVKVENKQGNPVAGAASIYSPTGNEYEYQASSPDEKALVEACRRFGIIYHGVKDNVMEVTFHDKMRRFKILHCFPFDSDRKRMSVVVEDDDLNITLICKGAEVGIMNRVISGDVELTEQIMEEYATQGLRTLAIAERVFTKKECKHFEEELRKAKRNSSDQEGILLDLCYEFECKLTLLGAVAVEDKLQAGVLDTIEALRTAGIKVWVLTGDKEETAVNISYAAGLFNTSMTELRLTRAQSEKECKKRLIKLLENTHESRQLLNNGALVIDGQSLMYAIEYEDDLRELCTQCQNVLVCRVSPFQKALVVRLMKKSPEKPVTAAIGDGANDVSMIQAAHVGLGIMGKEGNQAARSSDYAFGKFRFIQRAFFLHGHYYYYRIAILVQYFFYKNVAFVTAQVFYAVMSYFSQQTIYNSVYILLYNAVSTGLPILCFGVFEQHIPKKDLLVRVELYKTISRNALLTWKEFATWNFMALWHCSVFYCGYIGLLWNDVPIHANGKNIGIDGFGALVYLTCVVTVNAKLALETYYWCLPMFLSHVLTYVGLAVAIPVYFLLFDPTNIFFSLFQSPAALLGFVILLFIALLPDCIKKCVKDIRFNHVNSQRVSPSEIKSERKKSETKISDTTTNEIENKSEQSIKFADYPISKRFSLVNSRNSLPKIADLITTPENLVSPELQATEELD